MVTSTLVRLGLRLSLRGALVWAAAMISLPAITIAGWASAYKTPESKASLAKIVGANPAFRGFGGPARGLETAGGFMVWRVGLIALVMLSIWGLLTATRLLRGEEEAGRRELVLSRPLRARDFTVTTFAVLGLDLACIGGAVAIALIALGRAYSLETYDSVLFAAALVLGAGTFAAIGALASELLPTRRGAAGLAGFVLGAAEIARIVADGTGSADWLRWASPLGWFSELHLYSGARPTVLLLWVAAMVAAGSLTVWLAGRRDLGSAFLRPSDHARPHIKLLRSPETAALRFARGGAIAWAAGLSIFGFVVGVVSASVADIVGTSNFGEFMAPLGDIASVRGYLAFAEFLFLAVGVSFIAANSVSSHAEEERSGRAETVLATAISRPRWLGSRVLATAGTASVAVLASSLACAAAVALTHGGVGAGTLVVAGLAVLAPAAVFLGLGLVAFGLAPRVAGPVAYGLVAGSFLLQIVGSIARWPRWVLGLSPFHHLGAAPLLPVDVRASLVLVAIGGAGALVGHAAFARRDLLSS